MLGSRGPLPDSQVFTSARNSWAVARQVFTSDGKSWSVARQVFTTDGQSRCVARHVFTSDGQSSSVARQVFTNIVFIIVAVNIISRDIESHNAKRSVRAVPRWRGAARVFGTEFIVL